MDAKVTRTEETTTKAVKSAEYMTFQAWNMGFGDPEDGLLTKAD